jgi:pimeloyl-ACP methyl ester carboxylesterase
MNSGTHQFFKLFLIAILFSSACVLSQSGKAVSSDGVEIAYTVSGSGEPAIVFIHGWNCNKSYWKNQMTAFSPKYTVVAIDLAGYGQSGTNRVNYTMGAFGDDVAAVVNKLGLKKVVLVGHSMSGAVVIEAANKLKGKVIGVVGADTFQNLGLTMPADKVEQFLKPFRENFKETVKGFVKSMFPPNADTSLVKSVSADMSSADPRIALSAMQNMFADDGTAALKEFSVPLISINCDRYPILEESNRKMVKNYEIKKMKGVGHFVMLEDPLKFNALLQESVDELLKMD